MSQHRPSCLHNPATGRESRLPQIVARAERAGRRIVVVGGGPAGLEAARVAAERGHEVTLFEAAPDLGGQVLIGARPPWRRDLRGVVDWRAGEIERLGVTVRLNSLAEPEDVVALNPDVVIVATGGVPDLDWIDGAEHVTSVWDILTGQIPPGRSVVVYDGSGRHPAAHAAVVAATAGAEVTLASIDGQLAPELTYAERVAWKDHVYRRGIGTLFDHRLVAVGRDGNKLSVRLVNEVTRGETTLDADQVVVEHGTLPVDELFQALRARSANDGVTDIDPLLAGAPQPRTLRPEGAFELHRIGDAVASRSIHAAVLDALRLCSAM